MHSPTVHSHAGTIHAIWLVAIARPSKHAHGYERVPLMPPHPQHSSAV